MDLTLPREIPEIAHYLDKPMSILPFAVYKLIDLDDDDTSSLLNACAGGSHAHSREQIRLAPQASWTGQSLQSIIQYHVELIKDEEFDFFYFIVVTSKHWETDGVLLVTLDEVDDSGDEEMHGPDKIMVPAKEAASCLINLQIANIDWYDVKDSHAIPEQNPPRSPSPGSEVAGSSQAIDERSKLDFKDDAPDKRPPAGFYIGFYTSQGIESEEVLRQIQPAYRQQPRDDFICRFEGNLLSDSDIVSEACKLHPLRCMANKYLAKKVLVIADAADIARDGVILVSMQWDGEVTNKSVAEAAELGERSSRSHRRLICQTPMIVPEICDIVSGRSEFGGKRR